MKNQQDKLEEISRRITTFKSLLERSDSMPHIVALLDLMADLTTEVKRVEGIACYANAAHERPANSDNR